LPRSETGDANAEAYYGLVAQEQTDRVIRVIALEAVGQDLRELVLTRCKAMIAHTVDALTNEMLEGLKPTQH
jgi:hypothetical protein